ncbi:MAG: S-layer homology domain-containing protein [Candidatus Saganbacteria bacterium]|nr:S-layer homology domain-containing protein [Candidatus Saganbacteria bacterium]
MKRLFTLLCLLLLIGPAGAQLADLGIYPLQLEVGARPLGMGAAFVGLADDVNCVIYNPGGQAWVKGIGLTGSNIDNLTNVEAFPTGNNSSLGLAVVSARVANVPAPGGRATSSSNVVLLSYGTKLNFLPQLANQELFQKLGFGVSLKALLGEALSQTGQNDRAAAGWDMDLGILWKGGDWWSAGASWQNFLPPGTLGGGRLTWDVGGNEEVPASLKLGASAKVIGDVKSPVFIDGRELLVCGELDLTSSAALLRLGGEWGVNKTYYVRTGIIQQDKPGGPATNLTLGFGYRTGVWGVDLVRSHEPLRDEDRMYLSVLYFPGEWVVQKKLEIIRPGVLETALQKISLADNLETYDEQIDVMGQVKAGVEVYINDAQAVTDRDSGFKATVPLRLGKNLIVVEARYQGERKDWIYRVLRRAKVVVAEERELKDRLATATSSEEIAALKRQQQNIAAQRKSVEELVTLGVVEVTPGAEFKLDASLTRGDLATWLGKASGFQLPKVDRDLYTDVKKNDPRAPYIKIVVDTGLLTPFPDGTFRPDAPVTKEEGDRLFNLLKKAAK